MTVTVATYSVQSLPSGTNRAVKTMCKSHNLAFKARKLPVTYAVTMKKNKNRFISEVATITMS